MISRRDILLAATACAAPGLPAFAQAFPAKPIKLITSVTPGSATDAVARFLAEAVSRRLNAPMVVDPRPGAGGIVASQEVGRAPADGHTVLFAGIGHYLAQPLAGTLPAYDPVKDFTPIAKVGSASVVIAVKAGSQYKSLHDLIGAMREKPGQLTFSSGGIGSTAHLCGVMLNDATKTRALHVPYKGTATAVVDVAGGQVDFTCQSAAAILSIIQSGKLRPLAVTSQRRWSTLPDVPTAIEAGLPGFLVASWMGSFVPAATPQPVVQLLSDAMVAAAQSQAFKDLCDKQTIDVDVADHAHWAAGAAQEDAYWQRIAALLKQA